MTSTVSMTLAGTDGELRYVAVAWPPPTDGRGWAVELDAGIWMRDGTARDVPAADGAPRLIYHEERPTTDGILDDIRRYIGPTRLATLVDITEPARQLENLLTQHLSRFAVILEDLAIAEADTTRLASRVAGALSLDEEGDAPAILAGRAAGTLVLGGEAQRVALSRFLVEVARGAHPEPPVNWWMEPLGRLVQRNLGHFESDVMTASEAALKLGVSINEVVRLADEGQIERHDWSGVSRASVGALLEAERRG